MTNFDEMDRWDVQSVVCVKEYDSLKIGYHYRIKGRGDLRFNGDSRVNGKTVYGFCIEEEIPGMYIRPYAEKTKWHYFTLQEMCEYFITEDEDYQIYLRDRKLNEIID